MWLTIYGIITFWAIKSETFRAFPELLFIMHTHYLTSRFLITNHLLQIDASCNVLLAAQKFFQYATWYKNLMFKEWKYTTTTNRDFKSYETSINPEKK